MASDEFPAEWRKRVTRVIDIAKLRAKFKSYESQRKLFAEHDVFLGDARILNRLPAALGKSFYKTTAKRPIPVDIHARVPKGPDGKRPKQGGGRKNKGGGDDAGKPVNACTPAQLAAEIERAVGAVLVHLSPSAHTAVRVAYAGWTAEQVAANVEAAAKALVEKFVPGRWRNVKSLYVKGPETAALPVWLTEELWLEEKDVVADGSEAAQALLQAAEKPNIGKKRKSIGDDEAGAEADANAAESGPKTKKAKTKTKTSSKAKLPEGDDTKLDKEIADRKAALRKQKKAAKKALEV